MKRAKLTVSDLEAIAQFGRIVKNYQRILRIEQRQHERKINERRTQYVSTEKE